VEEVRGIPAPFPFAVGDNWLGRFLLAVNRFLIRISKRLFSYQIYMVVRPLPTLDWLLDRSITTSRQQERLGLSQSLDSLS
jgi:hypothetical protein